jgi:cytochrome c551/c552
MKIKLLFVFLVFVCLIQFVPYGSSINPPVSSEPVWSSQGTRDLFYRACGDCHSNQTEWPLYSRIAPISWLVRYDVDEGREHFNVSAWGQQEKNEGNEAAEAVREGEMPPWLYLIAHPEAKLSDAEESTLIRGLVATFGEKTEGHEEEHD